MAGAVHRTPISSFFQHLPAKLKFPDAKVFSKILQSLGQNVTESDLKIDNELYSIVFQNIEAEQSLAVANVRCEYINYQGVPLVLLVSDSNIQVNTQIGFNYGKDYWLSRKTVPEFFDTFGSIIPASTYKRTFYRLDFDDCYYVGELMPLIQQLSLKEMHITFKDNNQITRKMDFTIVLNELLRVHAITKEEYQGFKKDHVKSHTKKMFFASAQFDALQKKYNLPDVSQSSLEKGLRKAAANNNVSDLQKFIEVVKDINAQDDNPKVRRNALHWSAYKQHAHCYQLLIESGASTTIQDAHGKIATDYL